MAKQIRHHSVQRFATQIPYTFCSLCLTNWSLVWLCIAPKFKVIFVTFVDAMSFGICRTNLSVGFTSHIGKK